MSQAGRDVGDHCCAHGRNMGPEYGGKREATSVGWIRILSCWGDFNKLGEHEFLRPDQITQNQLCVNFWKRRQCHLLPPTNVSIKVEHLI